MLLNKTYFCATKLYAKPLLVSINARHLSIKVAIVGSGPAGFYTTQKLLKNPDIKVDIFEKLPVPFGLVRYGVAPDHADVKNVINSFTSVANSDRVNFYGNVSLGQNVALENLINSYNAVVLCYGSAQDKLLNIDGEQTTKNTVSARNFVGWYNGLPEDKDLDINLDCDTACIIGQGNVALDCARILLKPRNLERTDITSYAQQMIAKSKIERIFIIGRRGPIQVAFTTKELRELIKLNENNTRLEPTDIFDQYEVTQSKLGKLSRQRRRLTELMLNLIPNGERRQDGGIECIFKFLSKPLRLVADPKTGAISRLDLQKLEYGSTDDFMDADKKPEELDAYESIDCGLVIRSIGYTATMVDKSLPLNHKLGCVLNENGRVQGYKGLYCSGWLATGAIGVIAGTLNSSQMTAHSILEDLKEQRLPTGRTEKPGYEAIRRILEKQSVQVVHFNDWLRIDELERRIGETMGKTREKLVDVERMLKVAGGDNK